MSSLLDIQKIVDEKLQDEGSDTSKYEELADSILNIKELDQGTKESISAIFRKISTDEESHNRLLETIQQIIGKPSDKGDINA